jgi:hypothetical protein
MVVRELARTLPDAQIARVLNRLGYRTGAGNAWIQSRVDSLRNHNGIAVFNPERDGDGVVTIDTAAQILDVSTKAVRRACRGPSSKVEPDRIVKSSRSGSLFRR